MSLKQAIVCKYTCSKCGIYRRSVAVPAREDEDVITWLEQVCTPAIVRDHESRSPGCRPQKLDELMIPVDESNPKVGGAPK